MKNKSNTNVSNNMDNTDKTGNNIKNLIDSEAKYQVNFYNSELLEGYSIPDGCSLVREFVQGLVQEEVDSENLAGRPRINAAHFPGRQVSDELQGRQVSDELQGRQVSDELQGRQVSDELQGRQVSDELQGRQVSDEQQVDSETRNTLTISKNLRVSQPIYLNYTIDASNAANATDISNAANATDISNAANATDISNAVDIGNDEEGMDPGYFASQNSGKTSNLIIIEPFAEITIVEYYNNISDKIASLSNSNTEIIVNEGAKVNYYLMQSSTNHNSSNIFNKNVNLGQNSNLKSILLTTKNKLNEINFKVNLRGNNATSNTYICAKGIKQDIHNFNTTILHNAKHCKSSCTYKSIADDKSSTALTGNIIVAQNAVKTEAALSSKNLLLSDTAKINTVPQLEINCDDVKCSHAATVGHLDEKEIYYLRSRGIPLNIASKLLVDAFLAPILSNIKIKKLYDAYMRVFKGES